MTDMKELIERYIDAADADLGPVCTEGWVEEIRQRLRASAGNWGRYTAIALEMKNEERDTLIAEIERLRAKLDEANEAARTWENEAERRSRRYEECVSKLAELEAQEPAGEFVLGTDGEWHEAPGCKDAEPLFARPVPAEDAKDAERYRELLISCRGSVKSDLHTYERMLIGREDDSKALIEAEAQRLHNLLAAIDAAMANEEGK